MNDQGQLIPNEQDDLIQIPPIIRSIVLCIASTALTFCGPAFYYIFAQLISKNKENVDKDIKEQNPEKLFDTQLQDLLQKLDSEGDKQEIINKFIEDNFKEIDGYQFPNPDTKKDLVLHIQEFLSSSDNELMSDSKKKLKLTKFFVDLKNSNIPETLDKLVKIVVAKKMSDIILKSPKFGGYMTNLCFHQEFKLLESLLEGSNEDIIGRERLKSLAETKDKGPLEANLLKCSAIMGAVANDGYLKRVTEIYSEFPPQKLIDEYLMLNPENFKQIFQPKYFEKRKIIRNQKLYDSIQDSYPSFEEEIMLEVDLHPQTLYKEGGFERTTLEKLTTNIEELYDALKEGKGIMVKRGTLAPLEALFLNNGEKIDNNIKKQILVVKGHAVGIVTSAIGDQKSIADVVRDNVVENLKYLKETLTAIIKPSETPSEPEIVERGFKTQEL